MLFLWTFYSPKNPKKYNVSQFSQKYWAAQLLSTLILIRNVSWAVNQHIRMISEGSCDTEDWSNDAENSALITEINYVLTDIHIENSYLKNCNNISQFYCIFDQINAGLVSRRDFFATGSCWQKIRVICETSFKTGELLFLSLYSRLEDLVLNLSAE